jgi:hypothetical protein
MGGGGKVTWKESLHVYPQYFGTSVHLEMTQPCRRALTSTPCIASNLTKFYREITLTQADERSDPLSSA